MVMASPYEAWLTLLRRAAVEGFFFSAEAAASLTPVRRRRWEEYYQEGWGPLAALEEDMDGAHDAAEVNS